MHIAVLLRHASAGKRIGHPHDAGATGYKGNTITQIRTHVLIREPPGYQARWIAKSTTSTRVVRQVLSPLLQRPRRPAFATGFLNTAAIASFAHGSNSSEEFIASSGAFQ